MSARHHNINGNTAYGRIINLCSTRNLQSEPGTEGYSASKGDICSLTVDGRATVKLIYPK